ELGLRQATAAHSIAVAEVEMLAGDDAAAERVLETGLDDVTALADQHSAANIAWRLALVLARQGRDDEAERFPRLAERAPSRGLWVDVWWRVVLALVEAHRGRPADAVDLIREARARIDAVGARDSGMLADVLLEAAEVLRTSGHREEAAELIADAGTMAERLGYVIAA